MTGTLTTTKTNDLGHDLMDQRVTQRAAAILNRVSTQNHGFPTISDGGAHTEHGVRRQGRPPRPPAAELLQRRRYMGMALLGLGLVEFVAHWFLPYNGSVMATQTPVGQDSVGRVRQTPESVTVSRIYPQLNIAIGSAIAGAGLLATGSWPAVQMLFMRQCNEFLSFIIHIQACFQSMILIVTILPLAGVVNVHELALAAMLTVAEYFIMLFSDMSNQKQLSHWETIDAWRDDRNELPERVFRRATTTIQPQLGFHWMPVTLMLIIFGSVWIVIFMHLGDALNSASYSVEGDFVFIVVFTGALQAIIPIIKVIQLARPWLFVARGFCSYRYVVAIIDAVEFVNMTGVGIALMFAYGTVPK